MTHPETRRRTCRARAALVVALAWRGGGGFLAAADPDPQWLAAASRNIAHAEYEITAQVRPDQEEQGPTWQAPNRAQGFRTYFSPAGIRVVPRMEQVPSWVWGLSLTGWGRPGAVEAVETPSLRVAAERIEYQRGGVVEWYVNGPQGLEQGFALTQPEADGAEVWIELDLAGTLEPVVSADGQAIDFATPSGLRALRYTQLRVTDAMGRELKARMGGIDGGIRLVFADADALYPVTVEVLATSPAWTAESDQSTAFLGQSVATAGDVNGDGFSDVIIGAYLYDNGQTDEGRAFVYYGSVAGLAASPAWTAEGDQTSANFAYSVATAGDVNGDGFSDVIVGARWYDNVQADEGRAFVYHGSAAGLATTASWTAESNQLFAHFGDSVATAGDVNGDGFSDVIVGDDWYDNGQSDEGRAFVYHGSAAGLAATPAWTAESNQVSAHYGFSVATAGDVNADGFADVIVGAMVYDDNHSNEGRAFVYHGSAAGLAASPAWTAESGQLDAQLGWSVATAGDVNADGYADVIVGALAYDNGESNEGRVFVYHGSGTGLATSPSWTAESDLADALFGYSVAPAGDVNGDGYADVIVGANHFANGETDEGRAYLYRGSASGLAATPVWTAESDQASAQFGSSVASAGDVNGDGFADVIVGAHQYDNGQTDEGRAFVYHGSAAGLASGLPWTAEIDQAGANLGYSVATAGDVNGDGFADVIVGAYQYDNGQTDEGRAFVYQGSAAGLAGIAAWTAEGNQAGAFFGYSVATAGDVNGDGFADVIVGAYQYDNGQTDEGRAFVYHGSAAGLAASAAWTAESDQPGARFGFSLGPAGDVNGDGYADALVAAYLYSGDQSQEGRAFVYHGSAAGLAGSPSWTAESDQSLSGFGRSAASAGDVNEDGFSDVIVGAYSYNDGQARGRVFVYHGAAAGLTASAVWTAQIAQAAAQFGYSVASAGDVNGDGFAEVIVGAYLYDSAHADEGRAFLFNGSAAGLAAGPSWTAESGQLNGFFGGSVASAGDVNGDGYADVIVGAPVYDNGQFDEGRAYVFHGSAAGLAPSASWMAEGDQNAARFGISVASAGDVNGDGYADVIVGAQLYDNGQTDEGRAFVFQGNGGPGSSLRPRQRRADDAGPIARLGQSDSANSFRLALTGRSPFGRAPVKLQWEVKPLGVPFDGVGTAQSATWIDSGVGGAALNELAGGLAAQTPFHWRVRTRYLPAAVPFQSAGRWLTVPWNGWQEARLRTAAVPLAAGDVQALLVGAAGGGQIVLNWPASCRATDIDYAVYEGTLGSFTSHASRFCSTGGATTKTLTPLPGSHYYLVVPLSGTREGSYGTTSAGAQRPVGANACLPQQIGACD